MVHHIVMWNFKPEITEEQKPALKQAMARMEDRDRKLIILRYYKNQTQTQAAKELGMTQVQVSRREKKLMQYFRKELLE